MARTVREIMNREVLTLRPDMALHDANHLLRSFGVGAAPVVGDDGKPLGVLSVRDSLDTEGRAKDRMTRPALCVSSSALVEDAARRLAETSVHHLVVVDSSGGTVGMLSSLDLLRALLGMPTPHPQTFPHWDEATDACWSDDRPLDEENAERAPGGPGIVALVTSHVGEPDTIVWAEACRDVRSRTLEMAADPMHQEPALIQVLAHRGVRFRVARIADEAQRARTLALLQDRLDHLPPPGGN
ncbi:MAG TPA: CBS domain-containing protein [Polyangiaceae bacterium]|nr:CBS domain-containing protein [Polyangiaceae bacterium]